MSANPDFEPIIGPPLVTFIATVEYVSREATGVRTDDGTVRIKFFHDPKKILPGTKVEVTIKEVKK